MSSLDIILRRFEQPDETREFEKGRFEVVPIAGVEHRLSCPPFVYGGVFFP